MRLPLTNKRTLRSTVAIKLNGAFLWGMLIAFYRLTVSV